MLTLGRKGNGVWKDGHMFSLTFYYLIVIFFKVSHILQSQLHLYTTLLRDVLWYLTLNDVIQLASLLLLLPCDHLYKQTLTLVPKGIRRNQVYLKSVS